ncbi:MAG: chromosomal replication initiator protein DnaA [Chitinophagia bacterium]|nr:chromosomal replication initiator protein DnaA [Chitinophagia bacterium]
MNHTHASIWESCLSIIKSNLSDKSFNTWFKPIKSIRFNDNVLTIQVPNRFFYDYIEENYLGTLKKTIYQILGPKGRLEYKILVENTAATAPQERSFSSKDIKNPFVIPGLKKTKIESHLITKYTFDNYIEGDCNRLGRSAGLSISKKPGGTAFNPLVIYGNVGLGKTHLAHAIGNEIIKNFTDNNVLYLTTESFTNQIVAAIKNGTMEDLLNYYQLIDTLIVDDIQFLSGRDKTQDIFFNIFNQLQQTGKQIILTSDRPPKDLEGIKERLINRFKWGLTADLKSPDFETRLAILEHKMGSDVKQVPSNVKEYICFNIKNNIRELEGVMISLLAQSNLNNREIDIELAKEIIQKFVTQINKGITVENIARLVAEHFDVPIETLSSKTRKRQVVIARQLSMYLAKNYTKSSLKTIGDNFGGKDHSTVIYSINTVRDLIDTDSLFKDTVAELEKKVELSLMT